MQKYNKLCKTPNFFKKKSSLAHKFVVKLNRQFLPSWETADSYFFRLDSSSYLSALVLSQCRR